MTAQRPRRVQLSRTKGWRMPPNTVSVARPTRWGNPYKVGGAPGPWQHSITPNGVIETVEQAVEMYRQYALFVHFVPVKPEAKPYKGIYTHGVETLGAHARRLLRGRNLACWCPLEDDDGNRVPCHADVLIEVANQ